MEEHRSGTDKGPHRVLQNVASCWRRYPGGTRGGTGQYLGSTCDGTTEYCKTWDPVSGTRAVPVAGPQNTVKCGILQEAGRSPRLAFKILKAKRGGRSGKAQRQEQGAGSRTKGNNINIVVQLWSQMGYSSCMFPGCMLEISV